MRPIYYLMSPLYSFNGDKVEDLCYFFFSLVERGFLSSNTNLNDSYYDSFLYLL